MKLFSFLSKKEYVAFVALIVLFLAVRIPGVSLPYHQDEWKTAWALKTETGLSSLHHPPLTQIFFNIDGALFGADHLRIFPLLISIIVAILLFVVTKNRVGTKNAFFSLGLFTVCAYSVFASLMVDTDGAILPVFFLLAVYFYDKFKNVEGKRVYKWLILLALALTLGFMTKLSFVIAIGAIILDFIIDRYKSITRKQASVAILALLGFFGLSSFLILFTRLIYPTFDIGSMISHAASYAHLEGRNYFQSMIQGVKSLYYLSPLLLAPLFFINAEIFRRMRVFFLYLFLGFIFYFILFDFSAGALDKYLMFAIVPLSAITGTIFNNFFKVVSMRRGHTIFFGAFVCLLLLSLNFFPHDVIALYPKTEWFSRVIHLKWQIFNPFTGGNGPMGFYVSFLFIGATFFISAMVALLAIVKREWRSAACLIILMIGVMYNTVFIEEMLFGKINGSAPEVLAQTINFINKSPDITQVITYNDSGAYELSKAGKYAGRFYAVPAYEEGHRKLFSGFDGNYMIIDIPHLYETGFYGEFFKKCTRIFETRSGQIGGYVFKCPRVSDAV